MSFAQDALNLYSSFLVSYRGNHISTPGISSINKVPTVEVGSNPTDIFAHVNPEIHDFLTLLKRGRDITIPVPGQNLISNFLTDTFGLDIVPLEKNIELEKITNAYGWVSIDVHNTVILGIFTLFFLSMRYFMFFLLRGHSNRTIVNDESMNFNSKSDRDSIAADKKNKIKLENKYKKYITHCTAYIVMMTWGIRILRLAPWSYFNQEYKFDGIKEGWPHHFDRKDTPDLMQELSVFMMFQCSWYVAGGIENILHDRSRSDFFMMLLHHVLTICLIYGSFMSDSHRCAIHISTNLDIGDITMYYCKAYHLSTSNLDGTAKRNKQGIHLFYLTILSITWIATRLYLYGEETYIMYQVQGDTLPFIGKFLKVFLIILWVLQFLWGVALTKMTWDQFMKGEFVDNVSGDTNSLDKSGDMHANLETGNSKFGEAKGDRRKISKKPFEISQLSAHLKDLDVDSDYNMSGSTKSNSSIESVRNGPKRRKNAKRKGKS